MCVRHSILEECDQISRTVYSGRGPEKTRIELEVWEVGVFRATSRSIFCCLVFIELYSWASSCFTYATVCCTSFKTKAQTLCLQYALALLKECMRVIDFDRLSNIQGDTLQITQRHWTWQRCMIPMWTASRLYRACQPLEVMLCVPHWRVNTSLLVDTGIQQMNLRPHLSGQKFNPIHQLQVCAHAVFPLQLNG